MSLSRDPDVLDTWFSSALWPFSTLGWPDKTPELARYYPTSTLVTGFDIIFFWVARMMMMGMHFMGDVPFKDVEIHGLVRDGQGHKMSKTRGNVMDPLDIIDGISLDELITKRTAGLRQEEATNRVPARPRRSFRTASRPTARMRSGSRWRRWPRKARRKISVACASRATATSRPSSGMPRASPR